MQSEEQRLIDGLFDRLKAAGENSAPRDADAERWIEQHMRAQPGAAYYMAQTILIQEAAMKQLNGRIQALEAEVEQLKHSASRQQSSGGFLAGLFGGNKHEQEPPRPQAVARGSDPIPGAQQYQSAPPAGYAPQAAQGQYYNNAPRGGGFMAGALQTAAGVAGGVVLGNMLTSMFSHHQPQELVNIINEPAQPADNTPVNAVEDYNQADDSQFLNQDAGLQQDNSNDYVPASGEEDWNNDFAGDDFGGDDFGGDDDNWV
ncbi:DUF2076 domain-containing protein [Cronobacter muytjensii]|uniref:DUF2076 domain-containing protein n=1 Tax=Cronobacter muytjensii TaxID=413501 RepID=UPI0006AC9AB4|nr:DUF2076 domain-containing protein [Cronobacter muytjensii]ALB71638.1 ABC transporter substrate-binding protein [Cronobacter muytjensii ATCC 51329]EGT4339222.1 DUF2076 domain-containing protein [Cronobacter muytjensii]EKS1845542.1 DUF2076 domain-containing protein [Cronobacter muytjensii]ELY2495120.1 DUF2076 domain-containing protein [Cronobacter muytjensii]ELY4520582.1 DUF2076 domain-containing protein [Cronobacter muytjensii]